MTWQSDIEGLEKLEKVMNVEFVYSDFSYMVEIKDEDRKGRFVLQTSLVLFQ